MNKSGFYKKVVADIKAAGCIFKRDNNSHSIFHTPDNRMLVVPFKLQDVKIAERIKKAARPAQPRKYQHIVSYGK
jgi:hypothetical protein